MASDKTAVTAKRSTFPLWNELLTMLLRLVVGATFVFSGFVKAIDPWGTIFKVDDYLAAMQIALPDSIVFCGVFALFTIEFLLGVCFILGAYRRLAPSLAMLMMLVMLPLTLWIAVEDPVSDCGCFGDALVISHWQTFWKNVVLTVMVGWLVVFARKSRCFIIPTLQWLMVAATVLFVNAVAGYGYIYQPLMDFRPYPIGETLVSRDGGDEEVEFLFVYSKDGVEAEFTADALPEGDEWTFVDRKEVVRGDTEESAATSKLLRIYDADDEDVTESVVLDEGRQVILFYSSLDEVSIASTYQINSLYAYCQQQGIDMISVAAATPEEIAEWEDLSMPSYDIYIAEDTSIKEVVRGNPAVVFLEDGVVKFKSSLRAIAIADFMTEDTSTDPMSFAKDNKNILLKLSLIYLLSLLAIAVLSHVPMVVRYVRRRIRFRNLIVEEEEAIESADEASTAESEEQKSEQ